MAKRKFPSQHKAKMILRDGTAHGRPLTQAQRGLMGLLAGGKKPTKFRKRNVKKK